MARISDQILPPPTIDESSVGDAVKDNVDRLLLKRMSRFAYGGAVVSGRAPDSLPALHLMDHRVRLPRVKQTDDREEKPRPLRERLLERLKRMLVMTPHPGAMELVAGALRLDPTVDALLLEQAFQANPRFANLILRGRLGTALKLVPTLAPAMLEPRLAEGLIGRALLYHGALQTQLIAARGRYIDRLPLRLSSGPKAYTEAEACKDMVTALDAIDKIIRKLSGETKQPPQASVVTERKEYAEEIRAASGTLDEDLIDQATVFFLKRRDQLNQIRDNLKRISKNATVQTLHKSLFGATSVEAVLFAATRLVQLRGLATALVRMPPDALDKFIPVRSRALPTIADEDVAKLLYVYRALILRDNAAPPAIDDHGRSINLAARWKDNSSGNLPALNTAKKRAKFVKTDSCSRKRLVLRRASRLEDGQRIDVLPEFLLQRRPRVGRVLPGESALAQRKQKRGQERSNIPPNVRREKKRVVRR